MDKEKKALKWWKTLSLKRQGVLYIKYSGMIFYWNDPSLLEIKEIYLKNKINYK